MSATISGNRGLQLEEPLIFELDSPGASGVDLPEPPAGLPLRLGAVAPRGSIGLPGLSEPVAVRHYTRLSQKNYAIDAGLYPLGSCTMKHNPRLAEKIARLPGFADLHPLQPESTVQGALAVIVALSHWLKELTGLPALAFTPAAGAHGELAGMMAVKAALEHRAATSGDRPRRRVLVPESAHGTNPATAAALGFTVEAVPADASGRVDLEAFRRALGDPASSDVAALMLTNPNTCGLFEREILAIAEAVHQAGGFVYCDGANFNALVGRVRPADLGVDVMHINLHKTFATPHGGGGPGAGPVLLSADLAPFAPLPAVVLDESGFRLIEQPDAAAGTALTLGRLKGFHGQFGTLVRALSYILSLGADGLAQASGDAVLNANYLLAQLKDVLTPAFEGLCQHEALFDDRFLKGTGVSTLDFAKALIDEGFHPMTVYFPLVVHGALLIEPTESESKASLDQFVTVVRGLAERAQAGDAASFHQAPRLTPRRRLDETSAARKPVLRWTPTE